ncbi:MAG: hypothetical protein LRZ84_23985 [Desertifilum sp.]|nr:hypothetical protein [Desertifilum sp.]
MYFNFLGLSLSLPLLILLCFGILEWLHIPVGNFLDWLIGAASFWWLLVIVTVPWNIYFEAKEVLAEAETSTEKGIAVDAKQVAYAKMVEKRSLWIAIALHLLSTLGLYALAVTGVSVVGYIGSGAALLLTGLRPAIRTYEYLAARLAAIRQQVQYPREDVLEMRQRLEQLETTLERLEEQLDPEEPYSWAATYHRYWQESRRDIDNLVISHAELERTNQAEHRQLRQEAENAIAQLTVDSQFLNHVREIIRFVKTS